MTRPDNDDEPTPTPETQAEEPGQAQDAEARDLTPEPARPEPAAEPDEPEQPTAVERGESLLQRAADTIKNVAVVATLVSAIVGGAATLYWTYKGEPDLREFVLETITAPEASHALRPAVVRALLDVDEAYAEALMTRVANEATGNGEPPYKARNMVQSAFKANEIDEMREKVDSWHTFSFYRIYPSMRPSDGSGGLLPDTNGGQLNKTSHDIMIHPKDNLLLYIRPNSETFDGRSISSDPFKSLKIAGQEFPNAQRLLQLDAVPLNCFLEQRGGGYNLQQGGNGLKPIRIEMVPADGPRDKEFHFNVYVLSSKKNFDRSSCNA